MAAHKYDCRYLQGLTGVVLEALDGQSVATILDQLKGVMKKTRKDGIVIRLNDGVENYWK